MENKWKMENKSHVPNMEKPLIPLLIPLFNY
jgi:hypothetical protein